MWTPGNPYIGMCSSCTDTWDKNDAQLGMEHGQVS
jgi:hypothetical protein